VPSIILLEIRRNIALLEGCQFSPASLSNKNSILMKISVEQRLNETVGVLGETGRGKWKY
jgi:ABC-type glutathione transport system ATPase component